ncbi:MAG: 50S ribosomal protein L25/general stress protein Ctc [Coxiella sp. RIFCSPHIGHO2_12_FULL_44_14]|nr:MAG: 50S ribosomal protein L25/general stress protein Ctc [Coxiella sp. RIFCSPHIGHO2_12_FULL_44_14]
MATAFELTAELRTHSGKSAVRRLRRLEDKVPAILYGAKKDPQSIQLTHKELFKALGHEAVFSHILTLKFNDQEEKVILKALQRHPTKPRILHVDFLRIEATAKLTMTIPLHFTGEDQCPGVEQGGGIISHLMTEVEIRCLPADLPEYIALDISQLALDQSLHLSDLQLPHGVELTAGELDEEHNLTIVSVHLPRVTQEDREAEAAEAALAAESAASVSPEAAGPAPTVEGASEKSAGEAEKSASAKPKE